MKHTKGKLKCVVGINSYGGWKSPEQQISITSDDELTMVAYYTASFSEYPDDEINEANAKRIVQCWNSHDALVEALEMVCKQYQNVRDADSQFDGIPSRAISDAMEVLKSAKGE